MSSDITLKKPWLVAVWPGMGHVALSAGYYLMAKLGMYALAEFSPRGLFDVEYVDVKDGLIRSERFPRSRFFAWTDPNQDHDIVVFIGEAQPPQGKYLFCQRLIEFARQIGVERVFTFAAMATQMHPSDDSRVFVAATDGQILNELRVHSDLEVLEDGQIGGLNGLLLGVAAENGVQGACLLGEVPHVFVELPFPKASLAVLRIFSAYMNIELDFEELAQQADLVDEKLGELLTQVERALEAQQEADDEEASFEVELPEDDTGLSEVDSQRIERLFEQAQQNRSKAYELKRELDRLNVFSEYEDRFLDLFKKPGS